MSTDQSQPQGAGSRRWKTVLLTVSLGVNLLVAAAVVTHWAFDRHGPHDHGHGKAISRLFPREFFDELSAKRRDELRTLARETAHDQRGERGQFAKLINALADALERKPYDAGAVNAVLGQMGKKGEHLMMVRTAVTEKVISDLSDEERVSLARHMRERLDRWRKRHEDDD